MTKRRVWKDEEIKSMFNLRAQGNDIAVIATAMGTSTWTVGEILHRRKCADVEIDPLHVARVEARFQKTKAIDGTTGKAGVMPQAMKEADPAYKAANTTNMLPDLPDPREPAATQEDLNLVEPKKTITKAHALQSVLVHVSDANQARAAVKEALLVVEMLQQDAKRLEDKAFTYISELREMGFSVEFINSFLDECGLCTDGLPTKA